MSIRYTFDATFPDGSPRLFAGTWRPPFSECDFSTYFASVARISFRRDEMVEVYQAGAFDRSLYIDAEGVAT